MSYLIKQEEKIDLGIFKKIITSLPVTKFPDSPNKMSNNYFGIKNIDKIISSVIQSISSEIELS